MDESRRMILGFTLIFLVMLLFQFYSTSNKKKVVAEEPTEKIEAEEKIETAEEKKLPELLTGKDKIEKEDSTINIKLSTKLMDVYLSSKGGVIDSIYLKDYKVMLFSPDRSQALLSTSIITARTPVSTSTIPFDVKVEDKNSDKKVVFSYTLDSVLFSKTYSFNDSTYLVYLECSPESEYLYNISAFDTGEKFSREADYSGTVYYAGGKPYNIKRGELFKGSDESFSGVIEWVGYKTKYFFGGLIPEDYLDEFTLKKSPEAPSVCIRDVPRARLYFGPLKYPLLASTKKGLENAISFGWPIIRPIAKFIYQFMQFLHRYVRNYGVVIILFVICLVVVLYPLTMHQTKSMGKMKDLQQPMQEIKRKFKNDPARMNQEMMKLYRESGFNPFSSCLPMFLQMPIFFALFQVLNSSIELKGAPFILWLKDLSVKDPYFILPILTGISMFFQQRLMSPVNQDQQQKMMSYMMPFFITFIFLTLPSGLNLYFLTYNILMLGVQTIIQKSAKEA